MVNMPEADSARHPWSASEQVLSEIDANRRVYLCEHGLIHLVWDGNNLPYCPGDFMGLPFMLFNLVAECEVKCLQGERCTSARCGGEEIYLKYGTLRFPLDPCDCRPLHDMVQEAVTRVHELRRDGGYAGSHGAATALRQRRPQ